MSEMQASRDRIVSDMKVVLNDAEELIKLTAGEAGGKLAEVRSRLGDRLAATRVKLGDFEQTVVAKTKEAAKVTDTYVHDHPWQSVGVAAGVGFLLGLLIGRR